MRRFLTIAMTVILSAGMAAAQGKGSDSCDRACLEATVNQYLAAMVAHDASKAPLAKNVKYTENAATLAFTDGLWFTCSGLTDYKFYVSDPQSGQVAYVGLVKENDKTSLFSMRLKVVDRKITEVEHVIVRNVSEKNLANLKAPPAAFSEPLAPSERVSRQELIKISNLYFDGIEQSDGDIVPWDPECYRLENGMLTASNKPKPTPPPPAVGAPPAGGPGGGASLPGGSSCRDGLHSGGLSYIHNISPRRVPVVDEERGVTWGVYTFNHRGVPTVTLRNGTTRNAFMVGDPNSMPIAELFKIKSGKIQDIMAIAVRTPLNFGDGWLPGDLNTHSGKKNR